ncbi:MAG: hypothetical protein IPL20_05485 [Saprospiraceae bacterium]|nr:hypothetical protein [Saprospiraceae bacterium]
MLEDKKGIIWLGTDKGGVFSYDEKLLKIIQRLMD